jgi:RHS repeat-associated protein
LTDPVGNTTTWTYDSLGRAVEETNELGYTRYFVYNAAGYLLRQVDRLGRVRQFQYDNLGRNTAEIWYNSLQDADADTNRQRTLSFTYDAAGQMLSASDPDAEYAFVYDNLGRVIQITHSLAALTPSITFTQEYDAAGRRTRLAARINGTDDFVNNYTYDALGRLIRLTQGEQPGGRDVAEKRVDFSYDAAGRLAGLTRYADLAGTQHVAQSDYGYDQTGRLVDLVHYRGQTTFVDYGWSFDAAGRMTRYVNSVDGTADYTSDATGQLTAADYDYQTDESYEYDANGNRVRANGSTYTTGTNNRLVSDGTYRYLYDAEGNRTHRFIDNNQNGQLDQGDSDITKYNWDHRNRLYKVQHQASYGAAVDWVIRYSYDYENRLVRRRMDGDGDGSYEQKRAFVYDGNQIVMDFQRTGSGNIQATDLRWRYLWGPAVDQILAEEAVNGGADETVQWTLTDHLNTVRDIAKYDPQTGATTVVNHLVYDAFGRVTSESNPAVDSLFLFTARPFDADTELQNNLNRWYDASVGRWLSEDPVGFAAGDGNLYRYVGNAALGGSDPLGLDGCGSLGPEGARKMVKYYNDQKCCEQRLKEVLGDSKVAMLFACSKARGCVSRVTCRKLAPEVHARFVPGLLWNEIQVNQDPDSLFMAGESVKVMIHELYHSLILCSKGFIDWKKVLDSVLRRHRLTSQERRCAAGMAEELIAYRCSGMCEEFSACTRQAQESGNVQRACGNTWYASPIGSPLHKALVEFFGQVRSICNEVEKACQQFKRVESVLRQ